MAETTEVGIGLLALLLMIIEKFFERKDRENRK